MLKKNGLAASLIMLAAPAAAELTSEDVWANTTTIYQASGFDVSAEVTREGDMFFVEDFVITYPLPFDFGEMSLDMPPMTFIDQDDGSVVQQLPKTLSFRAKLGIEAIGPSEFVAEVKLSQDNYTAVATGNPGNITYVRSASGYSGAAEIAFEGDFLEMDFNFSGEGYEFTTQVVEGDLISVTTDSKMGDFAYDYATAENYGFSTNGEGRYGTSLSRTTMVLPASGFDITNLAPAFDAGMFIDLTSTASSSFDTASTFMNGTLTQRDETNAGPTQTEMKLSSDGFFASATVQDITFLVEENDLFAALIEGAVEGVSVGYDIPFMASDEQQSVALNLDIDNVTMADSTWDLFDAQGAFPRDPINMNMDMTAELTLGADLVNFAALETAFAGPVLPLALGDVVVNAVSISGAGVNADAKGEFVFPDQFLDTRADFPMPVGQGKVTVTGANAFLDALNTSGILPQSEAGMSRMMLGMFTRQTGDDALESTLEITEDGEVRVNGERIR